MKASKDNMQLLIALIAICGISLPVAAKPKTVTSSRLSVKAFCDGFETLATSNCRTDETPTAPSSKSTARQPEQIVRARQQCIELINSGLSQKRLRYDSDAAGRCLETAKSLLRDSTKSPALVAMLRNICNEVVTGLVPEGKSCESALDCQGSLACAGKHGGPPGLCGKRRGETEGCDDELMGGSQFYATIAPARPICEDGLHCKMSDTELACVKDLHAGDKCQGDCGSGLSCDHGVCKPTQKENLGWKCLRAP